MKIGLGFDKYPNKYDYIATFKDITGLEGEFMIEENVDEDNSINICQLTLFKCNINEKEFLAKFNKESDLYRQSAYIYILSSKGEILTANFISGIEIVKLFHDDQNYLNIIIDGGGYINQAKGLTK